MKKQTIILLLASMSFLAVSCQKADNKRTIKANQKAGGAQTSTKQSGSETKTDRTDISTNTKQNIKDMCSVELIAKAKDLSRIVKDEDHRTKEARARQDEQELKRIATETKEVCSAIETELNKIKEDGCFVDTARKSTITKSNISENCQYQSIQTETKQESAQRIAYEKEVLQKHENLKKEQFKGSDQFLSLFSNDSINWQKALIEKQVEDDAAEISAAAEQMEKVVCTATVANENTSELKEGFKVTDITAVTDQNLLPGKKALAASQKAVKLSLMFGATNSLAELVCINIDKNKIDRNSLIQILDLKIKAIEEVAKPATTAEAKPETAKPEAAKPATQPAAKVETAKPTTSQQAEVKAEAAKPAAEAAKPAAEAEIKVQDSKESKADEKSMGFSTQSKQESATDVPTQPAAAEVEEDVVISEEVATVEASATNTQVASTVAVKPATDLAGFVKEQKLHLQINNVAIIEKATALKSIVEEGKLRTSYLVNGAVVEEVEAFKAYNAGDMACRFVKRDNMTNISRLLDKERSILASRADIQKNYINVYFDQEGKTPLTLQCISLGEKTIGVISKAMGNAASVIIKK